MVSQGRSARGVRLLAAFALKVVHGIDRHGVAANAVDFVHGFLLLNLDQNFQPTVEASAVVLHYITGITPLSFPNMLCFGVSRYFFSLVPTTDISGARAWRRLPDIWGS